MSWSYNPKIAVTTLVWAIPRSLATTYGITIVFSSYGYLDVSVPHVRLSYDIPRMCGVGCPIRTSTDQIVLANPRSFSQLITSFFASESLGIPHTPLFCLCAAYINQYIGLFFLSNKLDRMYFLLVIIFLSQYVNELLQLIAAC